MKTFHPFSNNELFSLEEVGGLEDDSQFFPMENSEKKMSVKNDDDSRCRVLCCFRAKWADNLGNPKTFIIIFGILNVLQGMLFTYFIGVMTSIEAHFQLKSEALGYILTIGELLPAITAFVCSCFGGTCDRPRWMAFCMSMIGIGCYIATLPYYIFGIPTREHTSLNNTASSEGNSASSRLCFANYIYSTDNSLSNTTDVCHLAATQENNMYAVAIYLLGYTVYTNGTVILYVVGTPYLDDNVRQKNSPLYIAFTCSVRTAGPLIGFILSYACLSVYVNPKDNINFSADDPHWIGAWWIGYLVMGTIGFLAAFFIVQYPIRLPSRHLTPAIQMAIISAENKKSSSESKPPLSKRISSSIKVVLPAFRRVLTNIPYILRLASGLLTLFAITGLTLYLPKYMEQQFQLTKSEASMWTGTIMVSPSIIGILLAGYFIHRLRPTARRLSLAMVILKIIYTIILFILMFLYCENSYVIGTEEAISYSSCEGNCDCSPLPYSPICGSNGKNYLSPCHAGCSVVNQSIETWIYQNCSCIPDGKATPNLCGHSCSQFYVYIALTLAATFIFSAETVGHVLFTLRCVLIQDKSMALGLTACGCSVIIFIPGPLIYSSIVDKLCILWSSTCGERGNCLLYDLDQLRYVMHGIPSALFVVTVILDIIFWFKAKNVVMFPIDDEIDKEKFPTK